MLVKAFPEGVIRDNRVPDDRAGVGQRGFFALTEFPAVLEVQQSGILRLGNLALPGPDRPLRPSIGTVDGLGDVDATEFFRGMVEHTGAKSRLPRLGEGP